jgi:hypothetical protein
MKAVPPAALLAIVSLAVLSLVAAPAAAQSIPEVPITPGPSSALSAGTGEQAPSASPSIAIFGGLIACPCPMLGSGWLATAHLPIVARAWSWQSVLPRRGAGVGPALRELRTARR